MNKELIVLGAMGLLLGGVFVYVAIESLRINSEYNDKITEEEHQQWLKNYIKNYNVPRGWYEAPLGD